MGFPETRWTMLADATLNGDPAGQAALEELCRRYWPPLRDFLLVRGLRTEDAEDIAQDFFVGFVRSQSWQGAERTNGRFRSFLLGGLERTLADWFRRKTAQKRGGGMSAAQLHEHEDEIALPPPDESAFDAAWAERVMEIAMDALELEFDQAGRLEEFSVLIPFLSQSANPELNATAMRELSVSEGALKSKILRMRRGFRDCVLAEISRTVATPHDAEAELAYLCQILSEGAAQLPLRSRETGETFLRDQDL